MGINKFNIELAAYSALVKNGRENEVQLYGEDFEYGIENFDSRSDVMQWLSSQTFDKKEIQEMKKFVEKNKDTTDTTFKKILEVWNQYYLKSEIVKKDTKEKEEVLKNDVENSLSKNIQATKPVINQNKTTAKNKPTLNNNKTSLEELQGKGYIVKSGDWLNRVTKGINLNLDDKVPRKGANDIWPGDKITLEKGILYKYRNGNKTKVGKLINYVENTPTNNKTLIKKQVQAEKQKDLKNLTEEINKTIVPKAINNDIVDGAITIETIPDKATPIETNIPKIEEINLNDLTSFYKTNIENLTNIQNNLDELGLSFLQFLDGYKVFIETNLKGLDDNIINKIKSSILLKSNKIGKILEKSKKQSSEDKEDYKNYRWIVSYEIKDLFDEVNNEILPSAYLLKKYNETANKKEFEKDVMKGEVRGARFGYNLTFESIIKEIQEYFDTQPDEDGSFGEWLGRDDVIELDEERDLRILKKSGFSESSLNDINLLSEEDLKIQEDAQFAFMAVIGAIIANDVSSFTGVWTIPGLIIGAAYDAGDIIDHLINDEDAAITLLKTMGLVPKDFRMKIHWYDTILAGIGIIPGATAIIKGKKLANFTSNLSPKKLKRFNSLKDEVSGKIIGKPNKTKVQKTSVEKPTPKKVGETEPITSKGKVYEHKKLKNKDGTPKKYTKGDDGNFYNENGRKLNVKEENIKAIEDDSLKNVETNKTKEEVVKEKANVEDERASSELTSKTKIDKKLKLSKRKDKYNTEFKKLIEIKLKKVGESIDVGGSKITKHSSGKYKISGKNELFTKDELLSEIKLSDKRSFISSEAQLRVSKAKSGKEILKNKFLSWKGKYRVSKNEVIIREGGKERILNIEETNIFYKKHGVDLLKKFGKVNPEADATLLIGKLKKHFIDSKFGKIGKSFDDFMKSIPVIQHPYRFSRYVTEKGLDNILTPVKIIDNIKTSKGFSQTIKAILFADNSKGWVEGTIKTMGGTALFAGLGTYLELVYQGETEGDYSIDSGWNIAANYVELMYLGIINTLIIESMQLDKKVGIE